MNRSLQVFTALIFFLATINANAQNTDKKYSEKVRKNASTFHHNFSSGEFEENGPLVDEKIYVNSNNAIVIGRDNFVKRIKRFHTPFPALALHDRIVIVDENQVGLLYIMQGAQDGPYGPIPASGNKINVYAAEFFTMDDEVEMKELLTITQLDQLKRQISGKQKVEDYEKVTLLPIKKTTPSYKHMLKNNLDAYVQNFNTRNWDDFAAMFAANADININGKMLQGVAPLIHQMKSRIETLPDVSYHLIRNVVEGDRGALAYEVMANYPIPGKTDENGKPMTKLVMSKEGVHLQFNEEGKIIKAVIIYNTDDLKNQMK